MKSKLVILISFLTFRIFSMESSVMTYYRHATYVLEINNKKILVDPMLADIDKYDPIPMSYNKKRFPLNSIITSIDEITKVDGVIITHNHIDHFDDVAKEVIDKNIPLLCQPSDQKKIKEMGFKNVTVVDSKAKWMGLEVERFKGTHGGGFLSFLLGKSSSYLIKFDHKKIFITGDTLITKKQKKILKKLEPDTIIAYGGAATLKLLGQITMNNNDIVDIAVMFPNSNIVAIHMDSINHCQDTSDNLRQLVKDRYKNIIIPKKNEHINLNFLGI